MSELKAETFYLERESGERYAVEFYIKSEADKVIAEKDEKIEELEEHIDELQKATDSAWSKVNVYYDELRHHKYKRCLAMAEWCKARYDEEDARINGHGASWDYISLKMKYWERWQWRWEELKGDNERLRGESCKLTDGCLRLKQCRKEKANIADELRHSNHKRCMNMARWCRESLRLMRTYEVTEDFWNLEPGQDAEYFCKKGDFYHKWRKRWLELAEEPTWAKFLRLIRKEAK